MADTKTRIILLVDRAGENGWRFSQIAEQIIHLLGHSRIFTLIEYPDLKRDKRVWECEILVTFWHGSMPHADRWIRRRCTVLCLYDGVTWTGDGYPGPESFHASLAYADILAVSSDKIGDMVVDKVRPKIPMMPVFDGVDAEFFCPGAPRPRGPKFRVGWCGNSKTPQRTTVEDFRGLEMLTEAVAMVPGAKLCKLDVAMSRGLPLWRMPAWYRTLDVYVDPVYISGTGSGMLEAMACGVPVIVSEGAGQALDLIHDGTNGLITGRSPKCIGESLAEIEEHFRFGGNKTIRHSARKSVQRYSWRNMIHQWDHLFNVAEDEFMTKPERGPEREQAAVVVPTKPPHVRVTSNGHKSTTVTSQGKAHVILDLQMGES